MGHAIYVNQKSFSTLLHWVFFLHEWYFICFRICWSHLEDVFIFSSWELMFSWCGLPCVILVPTFIPVYCLSLCIFLLKHSLQKYPGEKNHIHTFKKQIFCSLYKESKEEGWDNEGSDDSLTCISTFFSYLPKISGIILQCYHFYFGTQLFFLFVCLFYLFSFSKWH